MARSLAVVLSFVLFAGCSEPGSIGASLVDSSGGAPTVVRIDATSFDAIDRLDVTGGASRILVGRVEDPVLGTTAATAYTDFSAPASLTDTYRNGTVTRASLILFGGYAYGYVDRSTKVRIHEMDTEWVSSGARSDSTIAMGAPVTEFEFTPGTTSVEVPLPASWVSEWDSALRSSDFSDLFHGFGFETIDGHAVAGFDLAGTVLKVFSAGDSAYYPALSSFTHLDMEQAPTSIGGSTLLQDGRNAGFRMSIDFTDERLEYSGLSRGVIALEADTSFSSNTPAGFVRPIARSLRLVAVSEDPAARLTVATAELTDGVFYFEASDLSTIIQLLVEGDSPLDYFEIAAPPADNGLGVLLIPPDRPPAAMLTVLKAQ